VPRHKNVQWNLPEGTSSASGGKTHKWESITAALLMDIRDELKQLNTTLSCFRVRRMSDDVHRIDKRLQKHLPLTRGGRKTW
jgi:hypothetical protein